jgi:hypothetical protein
MALESRLDQPIRTMGAEFECAVPLVGQGTTMDVQRQIAGILTANGIRAGFRGYSHMPLPPETDIMVESDSSVHGESRWAGITWAALEVKTRILQGLAEYERIVPPTLEILRALNCKVNTSTGHHLHVGFYEVNSDARVIRSLYNLIHRFEPVIFSLVSASRRSNSYCRPLPNVSKLLHKCHKLPCFEQALGHLERYQALNWTNLFCHDGAPRIEFRYHQGTLDATKAVHWARFCVQLLNHASTRSCQATPEQAPATKEGLRKLLTTCGFKINTKVYSKIAPELRQTGRYYLLKRWKELNLPATGKRSPRVPVESEG